MGGFLAKLSVSALMFDYILTGPISGVSAGQYIIGLVFDTLDYASTYRSVPKVDLDEETGDMAYTNWGSVVIAMRRHALLLPPEPHRHPRIERQGPEDHDRHHDHGRDHALLVLRHAGGQRARPTTCRSGRTSSRNTNCKKSIDRPDTDELRNDWVQDPKVIRPS